MISYLLVGYTGRKVEDLLSFTEAIDAALVDIRFSARSRNSDYDRQSLERTFGSRYLHLQDWGNRNYKGGPVEIVDFQRGLVKVERLSQSTRILLCACSDAANCHRTEVGKRLAALGYDVRELGGSNLQIPLY